MSTTEDSNNSDNSSEGPPIVNLAAAAILLAKYKAAVANAAPVVNPDLPFPKMTGRQWMELNLRNERKCLDNLRMSPDDFTHLHDILLGYGLKGTRQTGSLETLGIYVWTCAHNKAVRRSRDRFKRSLDTISRKVTHVAEVICRWADSILVPADSTYAGVKWQLGTYAPFFDGCIGALDGTHVKVKVNKEAKLDHINRKADVSVNVCAIVDMDGCFTYVGAGMEGSVHDMSVLKECWEEPNFPHPPHGRYYLVDAGYAMESGYMGPFKNTRLRNVIERTFGVLKGRWHILDWVPYCHRDKQKMIIMSCFALHNYLFIREHGFGSPTYPPSAWVQLNASNTMTAMREDISLGLWEE